MKGHLSERAEGSLLQFRSVLPDCEEGLKNRCFAPELVLWEGSSGSVAEDLKSRRWDWGYNWQRSSTLARREFCSFVWFIHSCFHLCSEVIKVLSICLILSFLFFIFLRFYLFVTVLGLPGCGLSLVVAGRDCPSLQCMCCSLQWLLLLQSMGSRALAQELWHMCLVAPQHMESPQTRDHSQCEHAVAQLLEADHLRWEQSEAACFFLTGKSFIWAILKGKLELTRHIGKGRDVWASRGKDVV